MQVAVAVAGLTESDRGAKIAAALRDWWTLGRSWSASSGWPCYSPDAKSDPCRKPQGGVGRLSGQECQLSDATRGVLSTVQPKMSPTKARRGKPRERVASEPTWGGPARSPVTRRNRLLGRAGDAKPRVYGPIGWTMIAGLPKSPLGESSARRLRAGGGGHFRGAEGSRWGRRGPKLGPKAPSLTAE